MFADHHRAAENGLKIASEAIESNDFSLVILDEVCLAIAKRLLEESDVIDAVRKADAGTTVVLTGRGASAALMDLADTVTEMREIKHGMRTGWPLRRG